MSVLRSWTLVIRRLPEARAVLIKKTIDKLPDAESWFTLTGAKLAYALPLTALLPLALVLFTLLSALA